MDISDAPKLRVVVVPVMNTTLTLQPLLRHLRYQKASFDELHLWINTLNPITQGYCERLSKSYAWITLVKPVDPVNGGKSVRQFFKYCVDPSTYYLYIADMIPYLTTTFVDVLFGVADRAGRFLAVANVLDDYALFLASPLNAVAVAAERGVALSPDETLMAFTWQGSDLALFDGVVDCPDITTCFTQHRPTELGKPDARVPDAVCVRYDLGGGHWLMPPSIVLKAFTDLSPSLLDDEMASMAVAGPQSRGSRLWDV